MTAFALLAHPALLNGVHIQVNLVRLDPVRVHRSIPDRDFSETGVDLELELFLGSEMELFTVLERPNLVCLLRHRTRSLRLIRLALDGFERQDDEPRYKCHRWITETEKAERRLIW